MTLRVRVRVRSLAVEVDAADEKRGARRPGGDGGVGEGARAAKPLRGFDVQQRLVRARQRVFADARGAETRAPVMNGTFEGHTRQREVETMRDDERRERLD